MVPLGAGSALAAMRAESPTAAPRRAARPCKTLLFHLQTPLNRFWNESSSAHPPPPHFPRPLSNAIYLLGFDFLFSNSSKFTNPIKFTNPYTN
jgi:hypothetical protein